MPGRVRRPSETIARDRRRAVRAARATRRDDVTSARRRAPCLRRGPAPGEVALDGAILHRDEPSAASPLSRDRASLRSFAAALSTARKGAWLVARHPVSPRARRAGLSRSGLLGARPRVNEVESGGARGADRRREARGPASLAEHAVRQRGFAATSSPARSREHGDRSRSAAGRSPRTRRRSHRSKANAIESIHEHGPERSEPARRAEVALVRSAQPPAARRPRFRARHERTCEPSIRGSGATRVHRAAPPACDRSPPELRPDPSNPGHLVSPGARRARPRPARRVRARGASGLEGPLCAGRSMRAPFGEPAEGGFARPSAKRSVVRTPEVPSTAGRALFEDPTRGFPQLVPNLWILW